MSAEQPEITESAFSGNDPARALENTGDSTDISVPEASIAPLNIGDQIVQEVMGLMRAGEWDGRKSADALALRHAITIGSAKQYAVQAGRFLRLHSEPDLMLGHLVTKLHAIVDDNGMDRVPAIKTLLDQLEKMEARRLKNGPQLTAVEKAERVRELLRDPPPELVEILEAAWGPRAVQPG
jgi:hypothetical protein